MKKSLKNELKECLSCQLMTQKHAELKNGLSALREELKTLASEVKRCIQYIDKIITEQAKSNVNLELLLSVRNKALNLPIKKNDRLFEIESNMGENMDTYTTIYSIMRNNGLNNGLPKLIARKVLSVFNYLGIKGKMSFKSLEHFNSLLYDGLLKEGYTHSQYIKDIKVAIKKAKIRYHKHEYDERHKSNLH